ncbi:MAG: hypothetical protein IPP32_16395 [Bacteroidetes bacterium]|nr:hypothetical protein [Bacteroidota bacterium]
MLNSFETNSSHNTYDLGIWEFVFAKEQSLILNFIEKKVKRLRFLQTKDLFSLPEGEAIKVNSQIKFLEQEIQVVHGFYKMTLEMENCYLDSIEKIHSDYANQNLKLATENYKLKKLNAALSIELRLSYKNSEFAYELLKNILKKN